MSDENLVEFPQGEAVGAEQPAEPPKQTKGRCLKCGQVVDLEDTFQPDPKKPRMHRIGVTRKNIVGSEVCGPVMLALIFHVWGKRQVEGQPERTFRVVLPAGMPPEENSTVLERWEQVLAEEMSKEHDVTCTVVIERWSLLAAEG